MNFWFIFISNYVAIQYLRMNVTISLRFSEEFDTLMWSQKTWFAIVSHFECDFNPESPATKSSEQCPDLMSSYISSKYR